MRLFVAIQLSDEMRKSIMGTLHDLKQKGVKGSYVPAMLAEILDAKVVHHTRGGARLAKPLSAKHSRLFRTKTLAADRMRTH